jgi:hypothetical protein
MADLPLLHGSARLPANFRIRMLPTGPDNSISICAVRSTPGIYAALTARNDRRRIALNGSAVPPTCRYTPGCGSESNQSRVSWGVYTGAECSTGAPPSASLSDLPAKIRKAQVTDGRPHPPSLLRPHRESRELNRSVPKSPARLVIPDCSEQPIQDSHDLDEGSDEWTNRPGPDDFRPRTGPSGEDRGHNHRPVRLRAWLR